MDRLRVVMKAPFANAWVIMAAPDHMFSIQIWSNDQLGFDRFPSFDFNARRFAARNYDARLLTKNADAS